MELALCNKNNIKIIWINKRGRKKQEKYKGVKKKEVKGKELKIKSQDKLNWLMKNLFATIKKLII
jgi:hypothetical protein